MENADTSITFDNLADRLVDAIPELKPAYADELRRWRGEKPGAYNIFDSVVAPYIPSLCETGGREEDLRRLFTFLEILAKHPDEEVQGVVSISVLEWLYGWYPNLLPLLIQFMGPATQQMLADVLAEPEAIDEQVVRESLLRALDAEPSLKERLRSSALFMEQYGHLLPGDG